VGPENIFIFGLTAEEVESLRPSYLPREYYRVDPFLKQAVDLIRDGFFSPEEKDLFKPLIDLLLNDDRYLVLADFADYHRCRMEVDALYRDPAAWTRKAILNVARMGKFSSDRTIMEYNREIWRARPISVIRADDCPPPQL
jgi:glycogen phosphorylase